MDAQSLIVYLIVAVCILTTVRWFYKRITKKKGQGCGCGCTGCSIAKKNNESCNCDSSNK